ncbi:hypothetical protein JCM10207_003896 [Rhodosporidiobolus poonsookiae]
MAPPHPHRISAIGLVEEVTTVLHRLVPALEHVHPEGGVSAGASGMGGVLLTAKLLPAATETTLHFFHSRAQPDPQFEAEVEDRLVGAANGTHLQWTQWSSGPSPFSFTDVRLRITAQAHIHLVQAPGYMYDLFQFVLHHSGDHELVGSWRLFAQLLLYFLFLEAHPHLPLAQQEVWAHLRLEDAPSVFAERLAQEDSPHAVVERARQTLTDATAIRVRTVLMGQVTVLLPAGARSAMRELRLEQIKRLFARILGWLVLPEPKELKAPPRKGGHSLRMDHGSSAGTHFAPSNFQAIEGYSLGRAAHARNPYKPESRRADGGGF